MSISIIVASIIALKQDVLKRRLAFSTISQLGYITLGAALLTQLGLTGGLLHIVNHAVAKSRSFVPGRIITMTGKEGSVNLMVWASECRCTMLAFTIGSIGMVGILPLNGFYSKWCDVGRPGRAYAHHYCYINDERSFKRLLFFPL